MNQPFESPLTDSLPAAGSEGLPSTGRPLVDRSSKLDRIFTRSLIFSAHLPVRSVQVARRCGLSAS